MLTHEELVWSAVDLAVHVLLDSDHAGDMPWAQPHDPEDGQPCAIWTLTSLWTSHPKVVKGWFKNAIENELDSADDIWARNYVDATIGIPTLHAELVKMLRESLAKV